MDWDWRMLHFTADGFGNQSIKPQGFHMGAICVSKSLAADNIIMALYFRRFWFIHLLQGAYRKHL
jgi:hypothetical protein